ncbi:MAG: alpha/beta hydrolase [Candidatus Levybacteria bacterium]|nr:alpha/beta hydrolase [Candidatus Levybacteria bacterium]
MLKKQTIPIVLLHGWSATITVEKYGELKKLLETEGYIVYTPYLPGFGDNPLPKEELFFDDYVAFVHEFITKKIKAQKAILMGHSFGGRVAIRFTSLYPSLVEKLVLIDASGIQRSLPSTKKRIVYFATKITRPLFSVVPFSLFYRFFRKAVYLAIGEMDYYSAGKLTKTFKNVYKIDVSEDLKKIGVPTLIVWGELDTTTPLVDGKYMHSYISGSKFVIIPGATHKLPNERPKELAQTILPFLV